jgi:uncharacterized protein (TIGR02597 family)
VDAGLKGRGEKMRATKQYSKGILAIVVLSSMAILTAINSNAQTITTAPVGFVNMVITQMVSGTTTAIGLPMQPMRNDQGYISAVSSNVITVNCSTCATSTYANPNALNYVEFMTGNGVGRYYAVTNNNATTITLSVGTENLTTLGGGGVLSNDMYVIRPFWRISDVFGPAGTSALQAGTAYTTADNILIWNPSTAGYLTIYARVLGLATNWTQFGVSGNVNNMPLLPDEGMFIMRRSAATTNIILAGEVNTTNLTTVLEQGVNLVGNGFPAGTVISNSMLVAPGTGFNPGATYTVADNVLVWSIANQGWQTVYDRTLGATTNWTMFGVSGTTNALVLGMGQGYMIYNKTTGGLWNRPLPYTP